jgi:hypothetical protein
MTNIVEQNIKFSDFSEKKCLCLITESPWEKYRYIPIEFKDKNLFDSTREFIHQTCINLGNNNLEIGILDNYGQYYFTKIYRPESGNERIEREQKIIINQNDELYKKELDESLIEFVKECIFSPNKTGPSNGFYKSNVEFFKKNLPYLNNVINELKDEVSELEESNLLLEEELDKCNNHLLNAFDELQKYDKEKIQNKILNDNLVKQLEEKNKKIKELEETIYKLI